MIISFIRSIILYILVCFAIRMMGKRQIGELQPFELVVAIMVSDLATVPMQDSSTPFLHGVIPILTILFMQLLFSFASFRNRRVRHFLNGRPRTLIENGVIKIENMRKELYTLADLTSSLRYEGYEDITTVHMAVLETNGQLSVIPNADNKPAIASMLSGNKKAQEAIQQDGHPLALIVDGQIEHTNLKEIGRNVKWLEKLLKSNGTPGTDYVFYACTIPGGKVFWQTYNEKTFVRDGGKKQYEK